MGRVHDELRIQSSAPYFRETFLENDMVHLKECTSASSLEDLFRDSFCAHSSTVSASSASDPVDMQMLFNFCRAGMCITDIEEKNLVIYIACLFRLFLKILP